MNKINLYLMGYILIHCFYVVIILFNLLLTHYLWRLAGLYLGVWAIIVHKTSSVQSWLWRSQNPLQQKINYYYYYYFFWGFSNFIALIWLSYKASCMLLQISVSSSSSSSSFWWFCYCIFFLNLVSNAFLGICIILLS